MGNVSGALIAAFIVGVAESLGAGYISVEYRDAIAFVLMIAVLLWRPLGLMGRRVGI
jgi:branched-chain amino acid transport system permease protein